MSHTIKEKEQLLQRVRRVRGQVEAVERALAAERECSEVLRLIAASRGAMDSLMAEVLEDHIRYHMVGTRNGKKIEPAAQQLIDLVRLPEIGREESACDKSGSHKGIGKTGARNGKRSGGTLP